MSLPILKLRAQINQLRQKKAEIEKKLVPLEKELDKALDKLIHCDCSHCEHYGLVREENCECHECDPGGFCDNNMHNNTNNNKNNNKETNKKGEEDEEERCVICLSDKNDPQELPCYHSFCSTCIVPLLDPGKCPLCRQPFTHKNGQIIPI